MFGQNFENTRVKKAKDKDGFLFERANILSKNPARKMGTKIKKEPTFSNKPWPKLAEISHFLHRTKVGPSCMSYRISCNIFYISCILQIKREKY